MSAMQLLHVTRSKVKVKVKVMRLSKLEILPPPFIMVADKCLMIVERLVSNT